MQLVENKDAVSINSILDMEGREVVANALSMVLADTYSLYLKTQYYHWNVTGRTFYDLHNLFERQYTELAEAIDNIAERIRALGYFSPGTMSQFLNLTKIKEDQDFPSAQAMVKNLVDANEACAQSCLDAKNIAESKDPVSEDMMISRMAYHQKEAWMFRSILIEE
jgi:starvation-inducible DNA-binding protein